jgi:hypothetical protein
VNAFILAHGEGLLGIPVIGMFIIGGVLGFQLGLQRKCPIIVALTTAFLAGLFGLCGYGLIDFPGLIAGGSVLLAYFLGKVSKK